MDGCALHILEKSGGSWRLNVHNLKTILMHPDTKGRKLVIISTVGSLRKGKSFLMSVFLNHLQRGRKDVKWLEEKPLHLPGFEWKNTIKPVTNGILMWSRAFPVESWTGEKIAVVLMDTQGTFDHNSEPCDNTLIFAMSTMMSSVQIYNQRSIIDKADLDHFQVFTEYSKMFQQQASNTQRAASGDHVAPPFQHLHFLIRDWTNTDDFELGREGGREYFEYVVSGTTMKKEIDTCFTQTNCTLLPPPGDEVIKPKMTPGMILDMEPEFRKHLGDFVMSILAPANLVMKTFGGQLVDARCYIDFIEAYFNTCKSGKIPEADSLFNLQANQSHLKVMEAVVNSFHARMDAEFGKQPWSVPSEVFTQKTRQFGQQAMQAFRDSRKMGETPEREMIHRDLLKKALDSVIVSQHNINELKKKNEEEVELTRRLKEKGEAEARKRNAIQQTFIRDLEKSLIQEKMELAMNFFPNQREQERRSDAEMYVKRLKENVIPCQMEGEALSTAHGAYIAKLNNEIEAVRRDLRKGMDAKQEQAKRDMEEKIREADERTKAAEKATKEAQENQARAAKSVSQARARDQEQNEEGWFTGLMRNTAMTVGIVADAVVDGVVWTAKTTGKAVIWTGKTTGKAAVWTAETTAKAAVGVKDVAVDVATPIIGAAGNIVSGLGGLVFSTAKGAFSKETWTGSRPG